MMNSRFRPVAALGRGLNAISRTEDRVEQWGNELPGRLWDMLTGDRGGTPTNNPLPGVRPMPGTQGFSEFVNGLTGNQMNGRGPLSSFGHGNPTGSYGVLASNAGSQPAPAAPSWLGDDSYWPSEGYGVGRDDAAADFGGRANPRPTGGRYQGNRGGTRGTVVADRNAPGGARAIESMMQGFRDQANQAMMDQAQREARERAARLIQ